MSAAFEVKTDTGRVFRVVAESGEAGGRIIANRHQVTVVAWRESRAAEDAIRVGIPGGVW